MKINVMKSELKKAVAAVNANTGEKGFFSMVEVKAENGNLILTSRYMDNAYKMDTVTAKVPAEIEGDGEKFFVKGSLFKDMVNKTVSEGSNLILTREAGKSLLEIGKSYSLVTRTVADYVKELEKVEEFAPRIGNAKKFSMKAEEFKKLVCQTIPTVDKRYVKENFKGILIEVKGGKAKFTATDGAAVVVASGEVDGGDNGVLRVPCEIIKKVASAVNNGILTVEYDGEVVVFGQSWLGIEGHLLDVKKYPNKEARNNIFTDGIKASAEVSVDELKNSLELTRVIANMRSDNMIKISLTGKSEIVVESRDDEEMKQNCSIRISAKGEGSGTVAVDAEKLSRVLAGIKEDEVKISISQTGSLQICGNEFISMVMQYNKRRSIAEVEKELEETVKKIQNREERLAQAKIGMKDAEKDIEQGKTVLQQLKMDMAEKRKARRTAKSELKKAIEKQFDKEIIAIFRIEKEISELADKLRDAESQLDAYKRIESGAIVQRIQDDLETDKRSYEYNKNELLPRLKAELDWIETIAT